LTYSEFTYRQLPTGPRPSRDPFQTPPARSPRSRGAEARRQSAIAYLAALEVLG